MTRRTRWPAPLVLIGLLAAYDITRSALVPSGAQTATNLAMIPVVGFVAVGARLSAAELGLARDRVAAGLSWGLQAFAAVTVALAVAASVPSLRGVVDDDRVDVGVAAMLLRALVVIPLATVVLEELAFRGVLLGLLRRARPDHRAGVLGAVAFGLWHVPGAIDDGLGGVVVTVAATTVAGLVFTWLRLGSGSLLAPALAHTATNSVTFVLAWSIAR